MAPSHARPHGSLLAGLRRQIREGARFLVAGGSSAIANLLVFSVVVAVGAPLLIAAGVAYAAAYALNFHLNRRWTFRVHGQGVSGQLWRFVVLSTAYLLLNWALLLLLVGLGMLPVPAQFIALVALVPFSYFGARHWAFRQGSRRSS